MSRWSARQSPEGNGKTVEVCIKPSQELCVHQKSQVTSCDWQSHVAGRVRVPLTEPVMVGLPPPHMENTCGWITTFMCVPYAGDRVIQGHCRGCQNTHFSVCNRATRWVKHWHRHAWHTLSTSAWHAECKVEGSCGNMDVADTRHWRYHHLPWVCFCPHCTPSCRLSPLMNMVLRHSSPLMKFRCSLVFSSVCVCNQALLSSESLKARCF